MCDDDSSFTKHQFTSRKRPFSKNLSGRRQGTLRRRPGAADADTATSSPTQGEGGAKAPPPMKRSASMPPPSGCWTPLCAATTAAAHEQRPLPPPLAGNAPPSPPLAGIGTIPMQAAGIRAARAPLVKLVGTRHSWDTRMHRGARPARPTRPTTKAVSRIVSTRTLSSKYLDHAAVDAWNVLAGAIELARDWVFRPEEIGDAHHHQVEDLDALFTLLVRLKLAVCLGVAWKFARSMHSRFHPVFFTEGGSSGEEDDDNPHGRENCTLELSYVGYLFHYDEEKEAFGPWALSNASAVRQLQKKMLALECELLTGRVPIFPLLANNAQSIAEIYLDQLFQARRISDKRCLQMRGLIPFFFMASLFQLESEPAPLYEHLLARNTAYCESGALALVCAAYLAIVCAHLPARDLPEPQELFEAYTFVQTAQLLTNGIRAPQSAHGRFFKRGAYNNPCWWGAAYLKVAVLTKALRAAEHLIHAPRAQHAHP